MITKYKKISKITILLAVLIVMAFSTVNVNAQEIADVQYDVHLHLFYGQGCPHCANLKLFLDGIKDKYPTLIIHEHEVYQNQNERELFEKMTENFNTQIEGVPTVFVDDKVIVGFSNAIGESLEREIQTCVKINCSNPEYKLASPETMHVTGESSPSKSPENKGMMQTLSIPIVVLAAAVDAINPCAFAVLIILMTAAMALADKKRALKFGLAFSISIYISYLLMGIGLLSALQVSGLSHYFYIAVTVLAVIVGLLNIKDYFWYGKVFLMEVPLSWRPTMKKILNSVTTPFGAFIAGFAVSLFELPCTGGPYIVILGLLAKEAMWETGLLYLLLYNLVFISPLIILSLLIYKGLSTTEKLEALRKKEIKVLHLIAGILMLIVAAVMIYSLTQGWV